MLKNTQGGVSPVIAVDRESAQPLHRQIYNAFRAGILGRNLQAGQQVPSSRALAAELGVSRIPVLDAYSQLLAEGYFDARQGAGTFVSKSLPADMPGRQDSNGNQVKPPSETRLVSKRAASLPGLNAAPWAARSGAFAVGMLAYDHFPFSVWSTLVARHARMVKASSLNYGDIMGLRELREPLAAYLRTSRSVQCDANQIMVVSGSQQALDLCARVLLDVGEPVWIEEPSYQMLRHALAMADVRTVPVPVDAEGISVIAGMEACATARAAYVTPSHQYPLGITMTASRRLQLLDWAHRNRTWILEDDYDSEFRYESMPIASLQGLDRNSRVIYIGTFSKTLFPALRLGYLVLPPDLVERFAVVRRAADICPPALHQSVLADFMTGGHFARHVRRTRALYNDRRRALVEAIRAELGAGFEVLGAEAGLHLVVTIPPRIPDREVSLRAAEGGLWLAPLSTTYVGQEKRQGFILGFGSVQAAEMPNAVAKLKALLTPWIK